MDELIKIVKRSEYETSIWSGGTTTQLLIYPEDALYRERNFKWRISSAKVEDEESVFTNLPCISRILIVIDGELSLAHEGRYNVTLKPFDQDSFMGDWGTKSFGKATDFNLMMNTGCSGELSSFSVDAGGDLKLELVPGNRNCENVTYVFYSVNGDLKAKIHDMEYDIHARDLISISSPEGKEFSEIKLLNKCDREIKIIEAAIHY